MVWTCLRSSLTIWGSNIYRNCWLVWIYPRCSPQTCQRAVEWKWAERHRRKAPVAWSERRPADLAIQNIMQARSQMSIYSQKFSNPVHDPAWVRRPKAGLDLEMMMMQKSGASECSPQCAAGWPRWLHSLRNSTTHYTHCTLYHTIHYTIKTIH